MSTKASPRKRASPGSSKSGSKASKIPRADGSPGTLGALFRKARTAPPSAERSKLAATAAEPEHEDPAALEDEDDEPVLSPATPAAAAPDASSVAGPAASLLLPLPLMPGREVVPFFCGAMGLPFSVDLGVNMLRCLQLQNNKAGQPHTCGMERNGGVLHELKMRRRSRMTMTQ